MPVTLQMGGAPKTLVVTANAPGAFATPGITFSPAGYVSTGPWVSGTDAAGSTTYSVAISPVAVGTTTATVTDAVGAPKSDTITVTPPPGPTDFSISWV
jgi:hypothetical protein